MNSLIQSYLENLSNSFDYKLNYQILQIRFFSKFRINRLTCSFITLTNIESASINITKKNEELTLKFLNFKLQNSTFALLMYLCFGCLIFIDTEVVFDQYLLQR